MFVDSKVIKENKKEGVLEQILSVYCKGRKW
jgi:hypothetical protein